MCTEGLEEFHSDGTALCFTSVSCKFDLQNPVFLGLTIPLYTVYFLCIFSNLYANTKLFRNFYLKYVAKNVPKLRDIDL